MTFSCSSCQQPFNIDDAKVPSGIFKVKCPKCGKLMTTQRTAETPSSPLTTEEQTVPPAVEAYVRRELAKMKQEILDATASSPAAPPKLHAESIHAPGATGSSEPRALVCDSDHSYLDSISNALKQMGYTVDVARTTKEAISKLDSDPYSLITVDYPLSDDKEGGRKIIARINGKKSILRRQILLILISANVKSADGNAAFFNGTNITVNKSEISSLANLIHEGQRHFQQLYSLFDRVLTEKAGQT